MAATRLANQLWNKGDKMVPTFFCGSQRAHTLNAPTIFDKIDIWGVEVVATVLHEQPESLLAFLKTNSAKKLDVTLRTTERRSTRGLHSFVTGALSRAVSRTIELRALDPYLKVEGIAEGTAANPYYVASIVLPFAGLVEVARLRGVTAFDVDTIASERSVTYTPTLIHDINLAIAGLALA